MAKKHISRELEEEVKPICTAADIIKMREQVQAVKVSDAVLAYIRNIVINIIVLRLYLILSYMRLHFCCRKFSEDGVERNIIYGK